MEKTFKERAKERTQKALDWLHFFRKKVVTSITYLSFRLYATEVTWDEVNGEMFKDALKYEALTLSSSDNLDVLLVEAGIASRMQKPGVAGSPTNARPCSR